MIDIAVISSAGAAYIGCDWAMSGADLSTDATLETAVNLSLFTDRQAAADDVLPDNTGDRRGWWGDSFLPALPDGTADHIGSRLWLLQRCVASPQTAARARRYCIEALQWLISDGVAQDVAVTASWQTRDRLAIAIAISRTSAAGAAVDHRFDYVWNATFAALA